MARRAADADAEFGGFARESRYKSGGTRIDRRCGVRCSSYSLSVISRLEISYVSLLKIDFLNVKTFCANVDFCEIMQTGSRAIALSADAVGASSAGRGFEEGESAKPRGRTA